MRSTALLLCLLTTVASAQQQTSAPSDSEFNPYPAPPAPPLVSAPPEPAPEPTPTEVPPAHVAPATPPPPAPTVAPAPSPAPAPLSTGPAESPRERAKRYGRSSAGSGGSTLIVTEVLTGIVGGAMLGSAYDISDVEGVGTDAFTGAVTGALALGTLGAVYQYFVPVGRYEGMLVSGAATTGFIAGLTLSNTHDLNSRETALLTLATTQVGVAGVLLLTSGPGDVSAGDAALVGASSLYACVLTGLFEYILADQQHRKFQFSPVLLAPALGMALGGLLAMPLELESHHVVQIAGIPLSVGMATLWVGSRVTDGSTAARTTVIAIGATLALTTLAYALSEPPPAQELARASTVQAIPVPVVMSAGRQDEALAAGPGLLVRF